jgi:hypothetical protein
MLFANRSGIAGGPFSGHGRPPVRGEIDRTELASLAVHVDDFEPDNSSKASR